MSEKIKKKFESLDEALASLPKSTYDHCTRVAAYLQILFLAACEAQVYANDEKVSARLKEKNLNIIRIIGLYHDIGKASVPEEYHTFSRDFSPEEVNLYEKHTGDSVRMVEMLFEDENAKFRPYEENYIREAIGFHHETWNGMGFPNRLHGKNIPILARMLNLIDTMDHWLCETHSENPMKDTFNRIEADSGVLFDPELVDLLKSVRNKIKRVFAANLQATRIIPQSNPFVSRSTRPFALYYRPVDNADDKHLAACEAQIKFKSSEDSKVLLDYADVEHIIKREKGMRKDLGIYMVLETCDMIRRLALCAIPVQNVGISLPTGYLNQKGAYKDILDCIKDSQLDPARLVIILTGADLGEKRVILKENLDKLRSAGVGVVVRDIVFKDFPRPVVKTEEQKPAENPQEAPSAEAQNAEQQPAEPAEANPEEQTEENAEANEATSTEFTGLTVDDLIELGIDIFSFVEQDAVLFENDKYAKQIKKLLGAGVIMASDEVDYSQYGKTMKYFDVRFRTGTLDGEFMLADDFVKAELEIFK